LPKGTPSEQVSGLIKQYDDALIAFGKLYDAAKSDEEIEKLYDVMPRANPYAVLFLQIAEDNPKDPAAVDALLWVVRNALSSGTSPDSPWTKAKAILIRDHLKHPKAGGLCRALIHESNKSETLSVIRDVLAHNPSKDAQGQAAYALAKVLRARSAFAQTLQELDEKELPRWEEAYGKEIVTALRGEDRAALEKEADELLERVVKDKDYAAIAIRRGITDEKLGDIADRELFELRHLQPGKPAPEIEGEDIDGKRMKLSDYRGKVVLLDFWGHW
jgi:hypothetical protein